MKVLHVIPSVSKVHGGPSYAIEMIERALAGAGVEVTTAATDDNGPGRRFADADLFRPEGVERRYFRKRTEFYKVAPSMLWWLFGHVRRYDVVHIHALFSFTSIAAALAARLRGVPYVIRPLGVLNAYGVTQRRPLLKQLSLRLIEGPVLRGAAAVHFTSTGEWEEARATGLSMRGIVIPLAVQIPPEVSSAVAPFRRVDGESVVLFLSRLDPKKNVEGLLRAIAILRERGTRVRLVIAGNGSCEYVDALKALAGTEGVADAVVWTGHIEGEAKWAALAAADIYVLPSFSENFGIAAAEALMAGKACVLGEGVAIAADVAEVGAGLVTAPDPASIAGCVERLVHDVALRQSLGELARELARRDYAPEVMANRLLELYARLTRDQKRRASPPAPRTSGAKRVAGTVADGAAASGKNSVAGKGHSA